MCVLAANVLPFFRRIPVTLGDYVSVNNNDRCPPSRCFKNNRLGVIFILITAIFPALNRQEDRLYWLISVFTCSNSSELSGSVESGFLNCSCITRKGGGLVESFASCFLFSTWSCPKYWPHAIQVTFLRQGKLHKSTWCQKPLLSSQGKFPLAFFFKLVCNNCADLSYLAICYIHCTSVFHSPRPVSFLLLP